MNIAFVGGGTGGHIFPIKSLIQYISINKEKNGKVKEIFWVGENNSLEQRICNSISNINVKFLPIRSGKLRRYITFDSIIKNLFDVFNFICGFVLSIYYILCYRIDVIFCKGGYVALPFVLAGWVLRKKVLLHESDTIPGLTNKIASKFSQKIFVGFPGVLAPSEFVGQILGDEILNIEPLGLDLDMNKTNVLVVGGSQGSKILYDKLFEILSSGNDFLKKMNFFIVLGTLNADIGVKFRNFDNVFTYDFVSQSMMGSLCDICDVGITRGGATSLAEQKLFGMKLIIVPLPFTGGNHQYHNALYYKNTYGDILVSQNNDGIGDLDTTLSTLSGYKKSFIESQDINLSKERIIEEIFS